MIDATSVTSYDSNRSAAMPAQSPTLSPTLSAMVAGLRGSSSGMPASTLPTRSAQTSAPLVKMPPPRRAKIEMSEAPNDQEPVIERDAEQREARDQHAGDGTGLERDRQTFGERFRCRLRGSHVG